jgi:uncharacterized membrane protein
MFESASTEIVIVCMAAIVYLTRVGGYFIGLQIRHLGDFRSIMEALPGCAMVAILVPAIRQGTVIELISLALVLGLIWTTNNVVIASLVGMLVLLFGDRVLV